MRLATILLGLLTAIDAGAAQQLSIGPISQKNNCVAIAGVQGNVTVGQGSITVREKTFTVNCRGLNDSSTQILTEVMRKLKKHELRLDVIEKKADDWHDNFLRLIERDSDEYGNGASKRKSDLSRQKVQDLVKSGKLDEAGQILDQVIASGINDVNQLAKIRFDRATVYELQFQPQQALPNYEKAYNYRPDIPEYGEAYGRLLYEQGEVIKAGQIYERLLLIRRDLAKRNPAKYLPSLAWTLNVLAIVDIRAKRAMKANDALTEALQKYRDLAKTDRAQSLSGEAWTLRNLGELYVTVENYKAAAKTNEKAVEIYQDLVKADRAKYTRDLAATLNSLGVAYASDKQWENAEKVFNDSLKINREMAQGNTQSYLPQIARTQMNIGVLYIERNRRLAAEHAFNQALQIYQNLTKANLPAYRPDLAQTLANRGTLYANWRDEDGNLVKVKQADRDLSDAVRNFRELVESPSGEIYRPHLARALHILGNLYREIERRPDSEELLKESLGIRRKLAEINSMAYSRELAVTLADLSRLYKAEERYAESASLCNEAVGISMKARENKSSDASYESFLRSLYCPPSVKELRGQAKK